MHEEYNVFIKSAAINVFHKNKHSVYVSCKYKGYKFKFCVSDHHSKYRANMITIISKSIEEKYLKQAAYDVFKELESTKLYIDNWDSN